MCNMFRDKSIKGFFTGSHFLHLHKMVEETSNNSTPAENFQRFFETRWCWHQYRACRMGENTELRGRITNDKKIMYKFNDTEA